MVHRAQGNPASSNIAPSTATISVVHNKQFAAAYGGFGFFHPMWVSWQETSNAVMCALLIYDVKSKDSTGKAHRSEDRTRRRRRRRKEMEKKKKRDGDEEHEEFVSVRAGDRKWG